MRTLHDDGKRRAGGPGGVGPAAGAGVAFAACSARLQAVAIVPALSWHGRGQ